jgi:hypothetical protein
MARPPDSHKAMMDPHEPQVAADVSPAFVAPPVGHQGSGRSHLLLPYVSFC